MANIGSEKTYDLYVELASAAENPRFGGTGVSLAANSSHQIAPDWTDLQIVPIYIDLGNNGTIDDTMFVANTVDVKDEGMLLVPREYDLTQNYPNPFNPSTRIAYALPEQSHVILTVYNILGQEVATLVDGVQNAGYRKVEWNAAHVASGVYLYRIEARSTSSSQVFAGSKKMMLIR